MNACPHFHTALLNGLNHAPQTHSCSKIESRECGELICILNFFININGYRKIEMSTGTFNYVFCLQAALMKPVTSQSKAFNIFIVQSNNNEVSGNSS